QVVFELVKKCALSYSEKKTVKLFEAIFRLYHLCPKESHITRDNITDDEVKTLTDFFPTAMNNIHFLFDFTDSTEITRSFLSGLTYFRLDVAPVVQQFVVDEQEKHHVEDTLFTCTAEYEEEARAGFRIVADTTKDTDGPPGHSWWLGRFNADEAPSLRDEYT
ncbi:hypothetical protein PFISCL1PPCAC_9264, partial [Pristionchus fissidentatus]